MKNIGKIFLSLLCVLICCAVSSNIRIYAEAIQPYSMPETNGIMFGEYYRIRLQGTYYYLTMKSTSDSENVGCSLQERKTGNTAQMFYLGGNNSSESYYISPLSSSSGKTISFATSSTANNISVVLKSGVSSTLQNWKITASSKSLFSISARADFRA